MFSHRVNYFCTTVQVKVIQVIFNIGWLVNKASVNDTLGHSYGLILDQISECQVPFNPP